MSQQSLNHDPIARISQQWQESIPDVAPTTVELMGRFVLFGKQLDITRQNICKQYQLNSSEFDILATLYRSGEPYQLTPRDLTQQTLLPSSGALTNRLDRLEKKSLLVRLRSETDRRSVHIQLSASGIELLNSAMPNYFTTIAKLFESLTEEQQQQLNQLLKAMMN